MALVAVLWLCGTALVEPGIASSNDGSHIALARALAVHHQTAIDADLDLTLRVDFARRDGHAYSDRPPGTAFLALPAVWLGSRLDPILARLTAATDDVIVTPAHGNYLRTYVARQRNGPALVTLQGTALAVALHTRLVGLIGLILLAAWLRRRDTATASRAVVLGLVGAASLWGPYATTLFSHVTAATLVTAFALAIDRDHDGRDGPWFAIAAGLFGAWAIACDYALVLAILPATLLLAKPSRWPWLALGAVPITAAVLAYHAAAFGSPWSIGYDFATNFAFARSRGETFDGDLVSGATVLIGVGRGAGLAAMAPLWLLGGVGLIAAGARRDKLLALAALPWLVALCLHRTPWGGGTVDHRYILPLLPLLAVGLAALIENLRSRGRLWRRAGLGGVGAAAIWSAWSVWSHFLAWQG